MRRWKRKGLTLFSLSQTCRSFRWEWRIMTCWWQSCTMTHQMMPSQPSVSTWLLKPVRPWWLITLIRNNEVVNLISHWSHCVAGVSGNWIEIAYGTSSGAVRVIVQHPETVGSGPQLFQTFTVHRSPVTKIMLSEKHLVSGTNYTDAGYYNEKRWWSIILPLFCWSVRRQ